MNADSMNSGSAEYCFATDAGRLRGSPGTGSPRARELFWEVAKNDLEDIFRWIPYSMKTPEDFQRLIDKAFEEQERGESVVFATVERSSGRVIGSTRFMNIDRVNRQGRDRVDLDRTRMAAHGRQHRGEVSDAAARV